MSVRSIKAKREAGFTLVELMIVVVIIGILAAIAIPQFQKFQLKSKHGESSNVIGGILTAQEAFASKWGVYVQIGQMPQPSFGVLPTGGKATWLLAGSTCNTLYVPPAVQGGSCAIGYSPQGRVYLTYAVDSPATYAMATPTMTLGTAGADGVLGGALGTDLGGYPCGHPAVVPGCAGNVGTIPAVAGLADFTIIASGDLDQDLVTGTYTANDENRDLLPTPSSYGDSTF